LLCQEFSKKSHQKQDDGDHDCRGTKIHFERVDQEIVFFQYIIISYSIQESIGKQIQKECGKIFPLQNVLIKKFKLIKKPKFDLTKLMELYQERPEQEKKEKKGDDNAEEKPSNLLKK
jgi:hypothetical protein